MSRCCFICLKLYSAVYMHVLLHTYFYYLLSYEHYYDLAFQSLYMTRYGQDFRWFIFITRSLLTLFVNKNIEVLSFLERPSEGEIYCWMIFTFLRMPNNPYIEVLIYIETGFKPDYTFHTFDCKLNLNDIYSSLWVFFRTSLNTATRIILSI